MGDRRTKGRRLKRKRHHWVTGPNHAVKETGVDLRAADLISNCGHLTPQTEAKLENLLRDPDDQKNVPTEAEVVEANGPDGPGWANMTPTIPLVEDDPELAAEAEAAEKERAREERGPTHAELLAIEQENA